jgi:hypothetical protein
MQLLIAMVGTAIFLLIGVLMFWFMAKAIIKSETTQTDESKIAQTQFSRTREQVRVLELIRLEQGKENPVAKIRTQELWDYLHILEAEDEKLRAQEIEKLTAHYITDQEQADLDRGHNPYRRKQ